MTAPHRRVNGNDDAESQVVAALADWLAAAASGPMPPHPNTFFTDCPPLPAVVRDGGDPAAVWALLHGEPPILVDTRDR